MHFIVGLGNPGDKYDRTRHNVGFIFLDHLRSEYSFPNFFQSSKHSGLVSEGVLPGGEVTLVKPDTFMNNSGSSVKKYINQNNLKQLIVVYDDVDLPLGEIKVSVGRGDGGHNGIKSIIGSVGSKDFVRIRVGISPKSFWTGKLKRPKGDRLSIHVLGKFKSGDQADLAEALKTAQSAVEMVMKDGVMEAMNQFN